MPKRQKQRSNFPMPPRVMDYGTDELWQRCHMIKERVDEHTVRARNLDNSRTIYALSGYALIYGELGQTEIWNTVDQQWKSYMENLNPEAITPKKWVEAIIKIASGRSAFFGISNRYSVRCSWELRVSHNLSSKGLVEDDRYYSRRRDRERQHESDIIEIISRTIYMGSWFCHAEDVFIAHYLWPLLPEDSDIEPSVKVRDFLRQLARIREDDTSQE